MIKKKIKIGTLFSGIGAFEHALKQLNLEHKILFACDCGERELPLKYGDLFELTKGLTHDEIVEYCTDYINKIGVKPEFRQVEICLLLSILENDSDRYDLNNPVVLSYQKDNRKSPVKHKLILTQEQIISLTPNMTLQL